MDELEPLKVDRELRETARRVERWTSELARGRGFDRDPFGGERLGKTLFQAVRELPSADPLRPELLRWVFRLAEQRIDGAWLVREAQLEHQSEHFVRAPVEGRFTLGAMTRAALSGVDAAEWHAARERSSTALGAHRAALWERRQEVAVRMGLTHFFELEPLEPLARAEARRVLDATREAARELVRPGFAGCVEGALARSANEGWPARLAPDALRALLGHEDWLRAVPLEPWTLPERLAPASFARALFQLGRAWAVGLAPRDQPFVVARDAGALGALTLGALFSGLTRQRRFLRKQLGLSDAQAREHARALSLSHACWVRLAATRSLLVPAALRGGAECSERYVELVTELTAREPARETRLGLFRLHTNEAQRFGAWLLAAARERELIEAYDEDWFRSPRAIEQLREETRLPPRKEASAEELAEGRALFERALHETLGR